MRKLLQLSVFLSATVKGNSAPLVDDVIMGGGAVKNLQPPPRKPSSPPPEEKVGEVDDGDKMWRIFARRVVANFAR